MIVDASAIVAVFAAESEAHGFAERLRQRAVRLTHPISLYESALAMGRLRKIAPDAALMGVRESLEKLDIHVVPVGSAEAAAALQAFARYGKGRHPAALNMGDCFSYAVAKLRGMPLLYKGDDFAQTDLA